jgi:hypothetical protein
MSWGVFPDERMGLSPLLDPLLESSLDPLWSLLVLVDLNLSHLQLTVSQSVSESVGQTFRLGLEPVIVCVRVSAVALSRLCPVLSVCPVSRLLSPLY